MDKKMHADGGTRYDKASVKGVAHRMCFAIKKHKSESKHFGFASLDGHVYKIVLASSTKDARECFNATGKIYKIFVGRLSVFEKDTYLNQMMCKAIYETAKKGVTHFFKDDIGVFLGAKEYDKTSFLTKPVGNFW